MFHLLKYNPEKLDRFPHLEERLILLHKQIRDEHVKRQKIRRRVTIITPTNKQMYKENIFANYQNQSYPDKELIVVLNQNLLNLREWVEYSRGFPNVKVFQIDETASLGECLNFAVDQSTGSYIARFDDDDYFGSNYLLDLIPCFEMTGADLVGKVAHFIYFQAYRQLVICDPHRGYRFEDYLPGGAQVVRREVFDRVRYQHWSLGEDSLFDRQCLEAGYTLYSADPFNFLRYRQQDKTHHTWKISDLEFMHAYCKMGITTDDPIPYITV